MSILHIVILLCHQCSHITVRISNWAPLGFCQTRSGNGGPSLQTVACPERKTAPGRDLNRRRNYGTDAVVLLTTPSLDCHFVICQIRDTGLDISTCIVDVVVKTHNNNLQKRTILLCCLENIMFDYCELTIIKI